MLKEYFTQYLHVSRGISDSSIRHYFTGLNSINALLKKYDHLVKDLYTVLTIEELEMVREFLSMNEEFIKKDSVGNNMYSVAFNHYFRFACQDEMFYKNNIGKMDIALPKPKQMLTSLRYAWKRNQIIVEQVIQSADYCCEYDIKHKTFTAHATGHMYMEGHHLIPLKNQEHFDNSLDVYANIISLCPICHRLLHHGICEEKSNVLERVFNERKDRLKSSGIDIGMRDLLALA